MDHGVRLEDCLGVDPRRLRVDDRHTRQHVRLVDPLAEDASRSRQLDSRVHTLRLHRIISLVNCDAVTVFDEELDRVCQVELALRVVRRQPVEHRPQPICPKDVDGGVHLAYGALLLRRVSELDDGGQPVVVGAKNASVLLGIVRLEREDGRDRTLASMCLDELPQDSRREKRRVSRENEHVVDGPVERVAGTADRVARSARLFLDDDGDAIERCGSGRCSDDDERIDAERARRFEHPVHHPASEDRVQVLRHLRAHARAEPCRHDDGAESPLTVRRHEAGAPGFEPGITGPKPVALPLGHAPLRGAHLASHARSTARSGRVTIVPPAWATLEAASTASSAWSKRP